MVDTQVKIREIVTNVMSTIKSKKHSGEQLVSFDLTECPRLVFGPIIMATLNKLGYIAYLLVSGGKEEHEYEWLYVDMTRLPKPIEVVPNSGSSQEIV